MAMAAAIFVSKRAQKVMFAGLCLATFQLLSVLASCEPEMAVPQAVRMPLSQALAR